MSNTKRIKTLQPILLAGSQVPRPVGFVAEVSEAEASALIGSGYATETKEAASEDTGERIEGFPHRFPAGIKEGSTNTDGSVVPPAVDAGATERGNIANAQAEAGISTKAPAAAKPAGKAK